MTPEQMYGLIAFGIGLFIGMLNQFGVFPEWMGSIMKLIFRIIFISIGAFLAIFWLTNVLRKAKN